MLKPFALATLASSILISPMVAQQRGNVTGGAASGARGIGITSHGHQGAHSSARRSGPWNYPYPYPYFDNGYDYGYDSEQAPPPQVVSAPPPAPAAPTVPPEPLLIEWHGDHFVRMPLSDKTAGAETQPDYSAKNSSTRADAGASAHALPPAVLVFRDGRKEEVGGYTIISGTIYSNTDYWSHGAWTKRIQIADLDVPATLKLNQERGLKFVLPAGPNEVVLRP